MGSRHRPVLATTIEAEDAICRESVRTQLDSAFDLENQLLSFRVADVCNELMIGFRLMRSGTDNTNGFLSAKLRNQFAAAKGIDGQTRMASVQL